MLEYSVYSRLGNNKLYGITKNSNVVASLLPASPQLTLGSKGHNSTFPYYGHVAYKIILNQEI